MVSLPERGGTSLYWPFSNITAGIVISSKSVESDHVTMNGGAPSVKSIQVSLTRIVSTESSLSTAYLAMTLVMPGHSPMPSMAVNPASLNLLFSSSCFRAV